MSLHKDESSNLKAAQWGAGTESALLLLRSTRLVPRVDRYIGHCGDSPAGIKGQVLREQSPRFALIPARIPSSRKIPNRDVRVGATVTGWECK